MPRGRPAVSLEETLARTERDPETGCWNWTGCTANGYGKATRGKRSLLLHRWVYEQLVGPIPEGMHLCHTCDNRACLNPDHLFIGTNADNHADKVRKGRQAKGEGNGAAKLNRAQVETIRAMKESGCRQVYIARIFGVSEATISMVINGKRWS